jgi:thiosulfate/3-mercaptopyruvate sulfurtransferase
MPLTTLIDCDELDRRLAATRVANRDLRLVDCRFDLADPSGGARAYADGHLPGAVYANLEQDLSGPKDGSNGRHPLPSPDDLIARLRTWGIDDETQVVAYDAQGGSFAARLWWLLRRLGHEAVAVLDGGVPAWIASGRPLETATPQVPAGRITAGPPLEQVIDAGDVLSATKSAGPLLLDARAPERFSGAVEPIDPVGGHIPGALNRFWQNNLDAGRFKSQAELRSEYLALLDGRAITEVVGYCGSGVTACHNLLALHVAGLPGATLYPGSWSEWVADRQRPVARSTD